MKNLSQKVLAAVMAVCIVMSFMPFIGMTSYAAASSKTKLNKKSVSLYVGKTSKLKVSGTSKTVKWTSSNKKVVAVKKTGKRTALITAKKTGTAYITAKVGNKRIKCKVTVKKSKFQKAVDKIIKNGEPIDPGWSLAADFYGKESSFVDPSGKTVKISVFTFVSKYQEPEIIFSASFDEDIWDEEENDYLKYDCLYELTLMAKGNRLYSGCPDYDSYGTLKDSYAGTGKGMTYDDKISSANMERAVKDLNIMKTEWDKLLKPMTGYTISTLRFSNWK